MVVGQINRTNDKSIAALILGILAVIVPYLGFVLGIIAIVLARKAMKEIHRTGEQGRGFAVAGLVCGIVGTAAYGLLILLFAAMVMFAFSFGP